VGRIDKTYVYITQVKGSSTDDDIAVYFNATVEELEKAGESFVNMAELTDGGYPASLGVYHELHCVVRCPLPNLYLLQKKYL
jgi:hypothetical protein